LVMPSQHVGITSRPAKADRHVLLTGPAKGMIDSVDAVVGVPGTRTNRTRQLRWLGSECGAVKHFHNLF
jgi:hypothetical protein